MAAQDPRQPAPSCRGYPVAKPLEAQRASLSVPQGTAQVERRGLGSRAAKDGAGLDSAGLDSPGQGRAELGKETRERAVALSPPSPPSPSRRGTCWGREGRRSSHVWREPRPRLLLPRAQGAGWGTLRQGARSWLPPAPAPAETAASFPPPPLCCQQEMQRQTCPSQPNGHPQSGRAGGGRRENSGKCGRTATPAGRGCGSKCWRQNQLPRTVTQSPPKTPRGILASLWTPSGEPGPAQRKRKRL